MRISVMLVVLVAFALLATVGFPAAALAYQDSQNRDVGPGVQPDPAYTQSQTEGIDDPDLDLAAGSSWVATIVAFFAGLGIGWLIFGRSRIRTSEDIDRRAA